MFFFYKQNYDNFCSFILFLCEIISTMNGNNIMPGEMIVCIQYSVYTNIDIIKNQIICTQFIVRTPKLNYNNQPANHN